MRRALRSDQPITELVKAAQKTKKFSVSALPVEIDEAINVYVGEDCEDWRDDIAHVTVVWVPLSKLIKSMWINRGIIDDDLTSFTMYHRWYMSSAFWKGSSYDKLWPVFLSDNKNVCYDSILEDGWHRFHTYVDRYRGKAAKTLIPCIYKLHSRKA